jgi:transposase-like protein
MSQTATTYKTEHIPERCQRCNKKTDEIYRTAGRSRRVKIYLCYPCRDIFNELRDQAETATKGLVK